MGVLGWLSGRLGLRVCSHPVFAKWLQMGAVPNVPIPVLRGIGVLGGYYVPTVAPCISPAPHLCRARGQPPRHHCSLPEPPPRPPVTLASRHVGILSSIHPGLPTPRDDPRLGVDQGARRVCGNEISDAYSKLAAPVMIWDRSLLPPPPIGCISRGPPPVIHKLTTTSIKHLLPCHKHENIHVPSSFHYYNHTSWFQGLPFKWSSGNFKMAPFAFHDDLRPRHCHACPDPHPMDVINFVSYCPTCEHLVQTYIQFWRPPFTTVVSQWWSATTHVGERRNFVQGLVPMSLYTKLTTPPSGRRKPAHGHDLKLALKARVPLLLNAPYRTLEWLNDNPPPAQLTPPAGPNSWGRPWSPYSTSHTALQRPPRLRPSPPPSRTKWHTSLQSSPVPHPLRHTPKLGNTPASPQDLSGLYP